MDTIFVFFSKSNYTKFIIHFLFYDYRTKKANDNRWQVVTGWSLSDEPAPDAAPSAHADFAAGGRGRDRIPSRLRCRFRAGRETSNPEREFDSFLSSCQPVKVEVDTIEPCLGHEKRRLRRTAFAKKQLPVCR